MNIYQEVKVLLRRELHLEIKNQYALGGLILQILSAVYIFYLIESQPNALTWNAFLWFLMIFSLINAVAKSIFFEHKNKLLYLKSLVSAKGYILSKIIYSCLLSLLVITLSCLFMMFFLPTDSFRVMPLFFVWIPAGLAFAIIYSSVSLIVSLSNGTSLIIPVLGFPLNLPVISIGAYASTTMIKGASALQLWQPIVALWLLCIILVVLAVILIQSIWKI